LGAAIDYLNEIGLNNIETYLQELKKYALKQLSKLDGITIYGHKDVKSGRVISFNLDDVHPHDLAQFLDQDNVAVRAGHHCAQPIMEKLGVSATIRASLYIYNTERDIDLLCASLEKTAKFFRGI
jgi:cysteine desulfurase/selenocysteine lyase